MSKKGMYYNASGYPDRTAYNALQSVIEEEKELERKVHITVKIIKYILELAGFELLDRLKIKDKKTGKEFR